MIKWQKGLREIVGREGGGMRKLEYMQILLEWFVLDSRVLVASRLDR